MNIMQEMYNIKIRNAQQAKCVNNYKKARLKLLKVNTLIWFNSGALIVDLMKTDNYVYCAFNNKYTKLNLASVYDIRVLVSVDSLRHCECVNDLTTFKHWPNSVIVPRLTFFSFSFLFVFRLM